MTIICGRPYHSMTRTTETRLAGCFRFESSKLVAKGSFAVVGMIIKMMLLMMFVPSSLPLVATATTTSWVKLGSVRLFCRLALYFSFLVGFLVCRRAFWWRWWNKVSSVRRSPGGFSSQIQKLNWSTTCFKFLPTVNQKTGRSIKSHEDRKNQSFRDWFQYHCFHNRIMN